MFWHKWSSGITYESISGLVGSIMSTSGPGRPIKSNISDPPGPLML